MHSLDSHDAQPLYARMAQQMAKLIDGRVFKPGQKLPSVRDMARTHGVSVSTAVEALRWLEERHVVFARPRAGYFVSSASRAPALPGVSNPPKHSLVVSRRSRVEALSLPPDRLVASFGGFSPRLPMFFDEARIRKALSQALRQHRKSLVDYSDLAGVPELCAAVAQRALHLGCQLRAEDVAITSSCTHAVALCLRSVTSPGDVVALESPTYFGFLDLLESLNLRALEIPTHPKEGMSLEALRLALDTQPIKAVLSVPTLANPLGAVMSHIHKRKLVHMLAEHSIPLVEDVVFSDLLASDERRRAAKSYDTQGLVMICGSFSKTLAPGIRLGWVEAGRWSESVKRLKRIQSGPTNPILEYALADLVTQGGYEARMRRLSEFMRLRLAEARGFIAQSFPKGTRISAPPSGFTLWLELPQNIHTGELFELCRQEGIVFGPGSLFTASDRFNHCMRLSFAGAWTDVEKRALARVGELARQAPWP